MKEFKEIKSAANYIETVYGTRDFARTLDINDAESLIDLMQDFSDYNLQATKYSKMLEMLTRAKDKLFTVNDPVTSSCNLAREIEQLIEAITK